MSRNIQKFGTPKNSGIKRAGGTDGDAGLYWTYMLVTLFQKEASVNHFWVLLFHVEIEKMVNPCYR